MKMRLLFSCVANCLSLSFTLWESVSLRSDVFTFTSIFAQQNGCWKFYFVNFSISFTLIRLLIFSSHLAVNFSWDTLNCQYIFVSASFLSIKIACYLLILCSPCWFHFHLYRLSVAVAVVANIFVCNGKRNEQINEEKKIIVY